MGVGVYNWDGQISIYEGKGQPEWAVIPYGTYLRLMEDTEML